MKSEVIYDLHAYINLLPSDKGGRKTSIFSGYKPAFAFHTKKQYSGELKILGNKKELRPGESGEVLVKLLPAITLKKNLHLNDSFTIMEGGKVVGTGIIFRLLNRREKEMVQSTD